MIDKQAFVSRFSAFINSADRALAAELVAPSAQFHVPGQGDPLIGPDGYLAIIGMMRSGFPDVKWQVEDSVAEGDTVAVRFTMTGTHDGPFMGVPATGRPIRVQALNFYRLADGKIVEEYGQPDMLGLMMQIGAIPLP